LREIAQSKGSITRTQDVQELVDDGYIIDTRTGLQLFSRLFVDFVKQQPEEDIYEGVSASAALSYTVLPTALKFAKTDEPLVTFHLSNHTNSKVEIRVSCELQRYSDESHQLVKLGPGQRQSVDLAVVLQDDPIRTLTNPRSATARYSAKLLAKNEQRLLEDRTEKLRLLPVDNFTFARKYQSLNLLVNFTWLIAAWVRKVYPALEPIRQEARKRHPLTGYPSDDDPAAVRVQVQALYEALKAHGLEYDNIALVFHHDHAEFVQRVRLPGQLIKEKAGNCLEG
jgi:hypothetical protein